MPDDASAGLDGAPDQDGGAAADSGQASDGGPVTDGGPPVDGAVVDSGPADAGPAVDASVPSHCSSSTRDGDESDVDCGGSCAPCGAGLGCTDGADCTSGRCDDGSGVCEADPLLQIAAGAGFSCAIRADGTVACWGIPVTGTIDPPDGEFESIGASGYEVCGVRADGSLACWGASAGDAVPEGTFTQVSVARWGTCALRSDQRVVCFRSGRSVSMLFAPTGRFLQVAAGETLRGLYACGLHTNRAVTCWDDDGVRDAPLDTDFEQVDAGYLMGCGVHEDGMGECWGDAARVGSSGPHPNTASIHAEPHAGPASARRNHVVTVTRTGRIQLRLFTSGRTYFWLETPTSAVFDQLDVGSSHGCGLTTEGRPVCWGSNESGQGHVPTFERFEQVSASLFGCGIRAEDRSLVCWGGARQVGDRETIRPPSGEFIRVAVGGASWGADRQGPMCGVRTDGSVSCWGVSEITAAPDEAFKQVAVAYSPTACGVLRNDTLACWGSDAYELDHPPRGEAFAQVRMGSRHACGLTVDGAIRCWGDDDSGRLDAPVGTFVDLSVSEHAGCALSTDGDVSCWGPGVSAGSLEGEEVVEIGLYGETLCGRHADGTVACGGDAGPPATMVFSELADHGDTPCGLRPGGTIWCGGSVRWGI